MSVASDERACGPIRDAALIVVLGAVLGLAFNWFGLAAKPSWGVSWVGRDELAELDAGPTVAAVESAPAETAAPPVSDDPLAVPPTVSDDPLAIPEAARTLPDIPAVGRPVKIETGAVAQLVDAGAAYVIDAREDWEYAEGHIPGAVNLPYDTAVTDPARLAAVDPGGRPIVVYCGGGTCEISLSLAWELIGAGHERVAVYMGGFPEWRDLGHPVAAGEGA